MNVAQVVSGLQSTTRRLEEEALRRDADLKNKVVIGRYRTDRTAPISSNDVQTPDKEGDIVRDGGYEYIVVNDSGTLKWARIALDVAW